eukprot:365126-Chlamydomonas_euryale.AAC.6
MMRSRPICGVGCRDKMLVRCFVWLGWGEMRWMGWGRAGVGWGGAGLVEAHVGLGRQASKGGKREGGPALDDQEN